jgi:Tfp pilus assembly protein PilZ
MDKRETVRTRKRTTVRYGVDAAERMAFTQNLSEAGVKVRTHRVFRPGTRLYLELKFPDRSFAMRGRVAWAKTVPPQLALVVDCGMGIRFLDPPDDWDEYYRTLAAH